MCDERGMVFFSFPFQYNSINVSVLEAELFDFVNVLVFFFVFLGSSSGSKLKVPELSINGIQHVVQAGQTLNLTCR